MKRGLLESVLGLAVLLLLGWALLAQAQATRETATAARVAAGGQTLAGAGVVLLAGLLAGVTLVGGAVIVFLWARLQREQTLRRRTIQARLQEPGPGQWTSGPNAYWGRAEEPARVVQPSRQEAAPLDALVQVEILRVLRELHPPARQPALPGEKDTEDDDGDVWETWY